VFYSFREKYQPHIVMPIVFPHEEEDSADSEDEDDDGEEEMTFEMMVNLRDAFARAMERHEEPDEITGNILL
jgi:hypothetical protein